MEEDLSMKNERRSKNLKGSNQQSKYVPGSKLNRYNNKKRESN
jgi:hypothetical protein